MVNKLQSKILKYLKEIGAYSVKVVRANKDGVPDIVACFEGKFYGFEIKSGRDKLRALQDYNIKEIRKAGGKAWVIYDIEDFMNAMREEQII